jgi:hypothetical protein
MLAAVAAVAVHPALLLLTSRLLLVTAAATGLSFLVRPMLWPLALAVEGWVLL